MQNDSSISSASHRNAVLIVDDEPPAQRSLARALELNGFRAVIAGSIREAKESVSRERIDVAFLDIMLNGESGLDLLKWMTNTHPLIPAVMFTKLRDIDKAVLAVKSGAYDYLEKGVDNDRIMVTVSNAVKWRELELERQGLRARLEEEDGMVGESPAMIQLRERIARLAPSEINLLIVGETGTGKELVANAIHNRSPRAPRNLEIVDSTMLDSLTEDRLFGHVKGAFTDAKEKRDGAFVRADGGTLFMDEIGKLERPTQSKLLRVLEQGTFKPLGSETEIKVDVRFIAATNRSLEKMVAQGEFLEDLYHRLKVGVIRVPPLRDRREDIPLLASALLAREFKRRNKPHPQLSTNALDKLLTFDWPGNVRQLKNLCEYLCAVNSGSDIEPEDIREWLSADSEPSAFDSGTKDYFSHMRDCKHEYFQRLLILHENNVPQVALAAGIDKAGCYRLLRTLGLHPKDGQKSTA